MRWTKNVSLPVTVGCLGYGLVYDTLRSGRRAGPRESRGTAVSRRDSALHREPERGSVAQPRSSCGGVPRWTAETARDDRFTWSTLDLWSLGLCELQRLEHDDDVVEE